MQATRLGREVSDAILSNLVLSKVFSGQHRLASDVIVSRVEIIAESRSRSPWTKLFGPNGARKTTTFRS